MRWLLRVKHVVAASIALGLLLAVGAHGSAREKFIRMNPAEMRRVMTFTPDPVYPPTGRLRGLHGSGEFRIRIVEETGRITKVEVAKSTGHKELDEAALEALRRWRVRPKSGYDGFLVPITFVR